MEESKSAPGGCDDMELDTEEGVVIAEVVCSGPMQDITSKIQWEPFKYGSSSEHIHMPTLLKNEIIVKPEKKCDVLCWNCSHGFDCPPKHLPMFYNNLTDTFSVLGYFCSWSCCMRYATDRKLQNYNESCVNINILAASEGCETPIIPAQPHCALKSFGGHLTIEQYRENFYIIDPTSRQVHTNTMVSYPLLFGVGREPSIKKAPAAKMPNIRSKPEVETRGLYHAYVEQQQDGPERKKSRGPLSGLIKNPK